VLKRRQTCPDFRIILGVGHEHTDALPSIRLLCTRDERPSWRAAEQQYERAPLHTTTDIPLRLGHRLMGGSSRTEAVAILGERRIPTLLQNLQYCLLDQSVARRWVFMQASETAQSTETAVGGCSKVLTQKELTR
jgi:hypothetical protein